MTEAQPTGPGREQTSPPASADGLSAGREPREQRVSRLPAVLALASLALGAALGLREALRHR